MTTQERLAKCFALALPGLSPAEVESASMASVAQWDSLATVNLIALVEEEFQLQIPDADLENFVSFELILDYLRSREHVA